MKSERPLKELMVDDQGCTKQKPGIGNIAYVKDIRTEKIVTTGFRCSIFGGFYHSTPGFGWVSIALATVSKTKNIKIGKLSRIFCFSTR
jgi:hypothetical protein